MIEVWRHHRAIGNIVVGGLIGVFLVLMLATVDRTGEIVTAIRATQQSNTSLTRETHSTAQRVESCVSPRGRCYKRGQRATGQAVASINRVVILAAACAVVTKPDAVPRTVAAIQQCVVDGLAAQNHNQP